MTFFVLFQFMRQEFVHGLRSNQQFFGLELSDITIDLLADYFDIVQRHNPLLHLVAPCSPEEFATRHVLESLTMLEHLPGDSRFVDIGSGGGLPAIPCLLVRKDLGATLIESKEKKSAFLVNAVEQLGLSKRTSVVNRQFEEADPGDAEFVTCRAIEKFTERLPRILKWSKARKFLFFGGPSLAEKLEELKVPYSKTLMPLSQQRYLFASKG